MKSISAGHPRSGTVTVKLLDFISYLSDHVSEASRDDDLMWFYAQKCDFHCLIFEILIWSVQNHEATIVLEQKTMILWYHFLTKIDPIQSTN